MVCLHCCEYAKRETLSQLTRQDARPGLPLAADRNQTYQSMKTVMASFPTLHPAHAEYRKVVNDDGHSSLGDSFRVTNKAFMCNSTLP